MVRTSKTLVEVGDRLVFNGLVGQANTGDTVFVKTMGRNGDVHLCDAFGGDAFPIPYATFVKLLEDQVYVLESEAK